MHKDKFHKRIVLFSFLIVLITLIFLIIFSIVNSKIQFKSFKKITHPKLNIYSNTPREKNILNKNMYEKNINEGLVNYGDIKKNILPLNTPKNISIFSNDVYYVKNVIDYIKKEIENIKSLDKKISKYNWSISIPKFDLYAPISSGVDQNTLLNYVGHFEDSSKVEGNICLAAHNRGFINNYFKDLHRLKINDVLVYRFYDYIASYCVREIHEIDETDRSYIDAEFEGMTLITCIKNKRNKRLCVVLSKLSEKKNVVEEL